MKLMNKIFITLIVLAAWFTIWATVTYNNREDHRYVLFKGYRADGKDMDYSRWGCPPWLECKYELEFEPERLEEPIRVCSPAVTSCHGLVAHADEASVKSDRPRQSRTR